MKHVWFGWFWTVGSDTDENQCSWWKLSAKSQLVWNSVSERARERRKTISCQFCMSSTTAMNGANAPSNRYGKGTRAQRFICKLWIRRTFHNVPNAKAGRVHTPQTHTHAPRTNTDNRQTDTQTKRQEENADDKRRVENMRDSTIRNSSSSATFAFGIFASRISPRPRLLLLLGTMQILFVDWNVNRARFTSIPGTNQTTVLLRVAGKLILHLFVCMSVDWYFIFFCVQFAHVCLLDVVWILPEFLYVRLKSYHRATFRVAPNIVCA